MNGQMHIVITASLTVFTAIGLGAVVRRLGWLTEQADRSLLNVIVRVLLPCLIFTVVIENESLRRADNLIVPPLVGFATMAGGCMIALGAGKLLGIERGAPRRTFAFSVGLYNYGYIPIPLVMALFDERTLGVLFIHNLGVDMAIWTVGILLLTGHGGWRRLINAPTIAIIVSVAANLGGVRPYLPDFFMNTADMIGAATIPLGLLLVGATMADHVTGAGSDRRMWRTRATLKIVGGSLLLRLLVIPLLMLAAAITLPVSLELQQVMAVQVAMPAAVITIVLAKHFGGDASVALRVALATSVAGMITIPIWIAISLRTLNL